MYPSDLGYGPREVPVNFCPNIRFVSFLQVGFPRYILEPCRRAFREYTSLILHRFRILMTLACLTSTQSFPWLHTIPLLTALTYHVYTTLLTAYSIIPHLVTLSDAD